MRVIATKNGFYGRKVKVGEEFEYAASLMRRNKIDKDGNFVRENGVILTAKDGEPFKATLPSWTVPATDETRKILADAARSETQKARDAAIAAAGPKRSRRGFASAVEEPPNKHLPADPADLV